MKVGFCGLGHMGLPMAVRLVETGHDLTVWNRTPGKDGPLRERGVKVATSPGEAARGADVVVTMLADGPALEEVLFGPGGVADGLRPGAVLVEMSTVGPDLILDVGARLPEGIDLLDAPVKGGPAKSSRGELRILVGGSEGAFRRAEPVLASLGAPRRLGPVGSGAAAKLVNNFAVITLVSVLGEAMALADGLGIAEDDALEILAATPLAATAERQWRRATGDARVSFKLRLAAKDLALAVGAARRAGRELHIGEVALERLEGAVRQGLGESDQAVVVRTIGRR